MEHLHFVPGLGVYFPATPPEPQAQPMMPYIDYTPLQLTPQLEYDSFAFTEPMQEHPRDRSLSEPFIFNANTAARPASLSLSSNAPPQKLPAVPISPIRTTPRVKAKRTPMACEECRKKKQKCDGEHPCQCCKEQNAECVYRDVPPTKKDNSLEKLVEMMEGFSNQLAALSSRIDTMGVALQHNERRMELLRSSCWQCGAGERC